MSQYIIVALVLLLVVATGAAVYFWTKADMLKDAFEFEQGWQDRERTYQYKDIDQHRQQIERLWHVIEGNRLTQAQLVTTNASLVTTHQMLLDEMDRNNVMWAREMLDATILPMTKDIADLNVDEPIPFILNEENDEVTEQSAEVVTMFPPDPNAPDPVFGD
jgi:hypothetical protein